MRNSIANGNVWVKLSIYEKHSVGELWNYISIIWNVILKTRGDRGDFHGVGLNFWPNYDYPEITSIRCPFKWFWLYEKPHSKSTQKQLSSIVIDFSVFECLHNKLIGFRILLREKIYLQQRFHYGICI